MMMIELLLATALDCEGSQELIEKIMKSQQSTLHKHELIEVIKTNTELGCYEGSEHNS
tara:strand:+ start:467 stop:640 length:174 start_codon:yes stop_codon:yes gene_type:complete